MKDRFVGIGGAIAGGLAIAGCATEYVEGTVVGIRTEEGKKNIVTLIEDLPVCSDNNGDTRECPTKPFEVKKEIWDAPDIILTLKGEDGQDREYYVWPRVKKKAVIGDPIKIDTRYASETDNNNSETILYQKEIEQ